MEDSTPTPTTPAAALPKPTRAQAWGMVAPLEPFAVRKEEAARLFGWSISTLEAVARDDPTFPKPRASSPGLNGYDVAELRAWWAARPVADRLPPRNTGRRKPTARTGHT